MVLNLSGGRSEEGNMNIIKVEEEGSKEEKIPVHHEARLQKKASSIWSWHEEFVVAWSETLATKKRKRRHMTNPKG